jgi:putative endonuclease
MKPKRSYVFVARCKDGKLYTGITNHPEAAVQALNTGNYARQARVTLPLRLAYSEEYMNENDAVSRAAAIKRMSKTQRECLLAGADSAQKGD